MPYSVEEILWNPDFWKNMNTEADLSRVYRYINLRNESEIEPEAVCFTEDSNSIQFLTAVCRENGLTCETLN